jgi:hypothetical protein
MKKNRLKRFILIINNFSCMIIFGVATMSLVSPGFFVSHKGVSTGEEGMGVQFETIPKREVETGVTVHSTPMEQGVVDTGREVGLLNNVQQDDCTLVTVLVR